MTLKALSSEAQEVSAKSNQLDIVIGRSLRDNREIVATVAASAIRYTDLHLKCALSIRLSIIEWVRKATEHD